MFVSYIVTPRVNPKDVKATHKFIFVSKNEPCWGLQRYLSLLKRSEGQIVQLGDFESISLSIVGVEKLKILLRQISKVTTLILVPAS